MNGKSVCCLEMTSSGIKLVIGYLQGGTIYVIHALESTRSKLLKGSIEDPSEMTISIKELINSASNTLKERISEVVLGIPSIDLSIEQVNSETNTTDPNSNVTLFDGSNCLHMIEKQKIDSEGLKTVLDVVPYEYTIDGPKSFRRFPTNQNSLTLGMKADVEILPSVVVNSFKKVVNDAGLKIKKIVNTTNAAIKYINSYQKAPSEFLFIDFGARITTIGFSYDSRLCRTNTINFGSDDITERIARDFNLDFQTADYYKETYGLSDDPKFSYSTKENIKLSDIKKSIISSLTPFVDGLSQLILSIDATARNLFIISGGGSDLFGLDSYLSQYFQNRVLRFTPNSYGARNTIFTNCLAMIMYYSTYELKSSPSRPVDLTLTRIIPNVRPNEKKDDSNSKEGKPQTSYSGLPDERL